MNGDDYQWVVPTLLVAFVVALVSHACLRRYWLACLLTGASGGLALMVLGVASVYREISLNNIGHLIAWVGVFFGPGFLVGLCPAALVGMAFFLARKYKAKQAQQG